MPWTIELLVFGWVHMYSNEFDLFVPKAIITLFLSFYGGVFKWNYDGNELLQFLNYPDRALQSPSFHVNNIVFQCVIKPNQWIRGQNIEYVQYSLEVPQFPRNLVSITVFCQLRCKETSFIWKCIKIFKKNKVNISWWNTCNTMKIDQTNANHLHCACMIDILQVRYRDNLKNFNKPVHINRESQIRYVISEKLLKQNQTIFSKNFGNDDNWSIYCAPNGLLRNDFGRIHFGLQLLALPPNVKSIRVKIIFKINDNDDSIKQQIGNFSYQYNSMQIYLMEQSEYINLSEIVITVFLQLLTVIDENDREIGKSVWNMTGVDRSLISKPFIKRFNSRIESKQLPTMPTNIIQKSSKRCSWCGNQNALNQSACNACKVPLPQTKSEYILCAAGNERVKVTVNEESPLLIPNETEITIEQKDARKSNCCSCCCLLFRKCFDKLFYS